MYLQLSYVTKGSLKPGRYSGYFKIYDCLDHFLVPNSEFQYFWGFQRMNILGCGENLDSFGGHHKTGLFWGSFLYILGLFLKVNLQN